MRAFRWSLSLLTLLAVVGCAPDADGDGYRGDDDCDDDDPSVFVGGTEVCDGADNDCNGTVDDGASDALTFYADSDGDGFGDAAATTDACEAPEGYVADATDCDDGAADVNPAADELCNDVDDDCDQAIDEDDAIDALTWFEDFDEDGFGNPDVSTAACDQPDGFVGDDTDCDDDDALVNPGADEVCNDVDDDCDDDIDEDDAIDAPAWYGDFDMDGLGDPGNEKFACDEPTNFVDNADDCDDSNEVILECCSTDAGDGDLILTADGELEGGLYWFDTVEVPVGVTLTVTGSRPLVIYAVDVDISGTIDLAGADGLDSSPSQLPDGGDAGPGGGGGGGGGDCGNGGGDGGFPNGLDAADGETPGGNGGLPYALAFVDTAIGGEFNCGNGGGGGGHYAAGGLGLTAFSGCVPVSPAGEGGAAYGTESLDLGFYGGGGGAGGGANGGGGGGGGGALAIYANEIGVSGTIDVSGGDGGGKLDGGCGSGGGGSGAGGTIWLHADIVDISGVLDASAGAVAPLDSGAGLNGAGGQGAAGRVRISGASSTITGTIDAGSRFEDVTYPECVWDDDTIYDVQDGTIGSDEATVLRDIVVTGVSGSGFYGQEADGGEYSGVYVYTTSGLDLDIALGDRVSVWGTTTEYNGLTEVLPTFAMWHGAGDPLDPEMITPADLSADFEPWEGVLVGLDSVTVDNPDLGFGEFSVDDGVRVDDQLYRWHDTYTLSTGDTFTGLYGVLNYTFGDYKIEPRSADDMVGYVAVE